jgi:hypothetical protein
VIAISSLPCPGPADGPVAGPGAGAGTVDSASGAVLPEGAAEPGDAEVEVAGLAEASPEEVPPP